MSNPIDIKYVVEAFDAISGVIQVRYINPYGPIALGQKKPEECVTEFAYKRRNDETGEIEEAVMLEPIPNPNADHVVSFLLARGADNKFPTGDALHIAICARAPTNLWDYVERLALVGDDEAGAEAINSLIGVDYTAAYVPFAGVFPNTTVETLKPETMTTAEDAWNADNAESAGV